MDNGLIFPYPLTRAQTEPTETNILKPPAGSSDRVGWGGVDLRWW